MRKKTYEEVSNYIRNKRIEKGFATKASFYSYLNVSKKVYAPVESGKMAKIETYLKVAIGLGVTIEDIFIEK